MGLKNLLGLKKESSEPPLLSDYLSYLLSRVKKLGDKVASDLMIPRVDVTTLHIGQPMNEVIDIMKTQGYSRYPVWKDKLDNIVGILYVKDLLYLLESQENSLNLKDTEITESMLRKSFFIPESKKIESLLKEFQNKKVHLSVVLDEYGGFSGIVTLEDIIEVIIGDIQDEYDTETAEIRKISENIYEIDARASLEELQEELGLDFSAYLDEIDTLGGLIYNTLERVPRIGEELEIGGAIYQIVKKEGNKILIIKVKIPSSKTSGNHE